MNGTIKAFIVIALYFGIAILAGRGAYWGLGWPLRVCQLIAVPVIILGCCMAYAVRGNS